MMTEDDKKLTEKDSLLLIHQMINKAKNSYHDTGIGPILWGAVITLCSLVTFLQIKFEFSLPFDIWLLTFIAIVPQVFIAVKEGRASKVKGFDDAVLDAVWICFGCSIFLLIFINANIVNALAPVFKTYKEVKGTAPEFNYGSFITSFFLMLYGIPTLITGVARKLKVMVWGGVICWVCCIISVFTKVDWDMLLMATAAISAWLVPGIIIRSRYLKKTAADV